MIDAALFPPLETMLAVARTGSVGAAARQRHITSSAVSQQIRRLETHFGIKLFERAGRGVRLTAAGEAALPVVRELWSAAEAAFGQLAELAGRPATTLRVAASDYLGKGLLAPVLRDLLDEEPPVRFEIVTTHSRAGVRLVASGDVDLAVVTGQETPRGLESRHLFDQPFVWVGPRRGRRDRAPLTERLRREPVLRLAAESRGRALLDQYLADASHPPGVDDRRAERVAAALLRLGRARHRAGPGPRARRGAAGPHRPRARAGAGAARGAGLARRRPPPARPGPPRRPPRRRGGARRRETRRTRRARRR